MNIIDFTQADWINPPRQFLADYNTVSITTEPKTDFWQRSYYGFRNNNAPAVLLNLQGNFSFTVKAEFVYKQQFDQCGLVLYHDSDNWFKASVEYENAKLSRLGSVSTNFGYSDWATTDTSSCSSMWYRLSRRGPDFLLEHSTNGKKFLQMRIFHMHHLGDTDPQMGQADPPLVTEAAVKVGVYACSPNESTFDARFVSATVGRSLWTSHKLT